MTTNTNEDDRRWAYYIRVSSFDQETGEASQLSSVHDWLEDNGISTDDVDKYADRAKSGSDDSRQQFRNLVEAVEDGEYTDVVFPELSRLARKTSTSASFIDEAIDNGVTIHLMDDMIDAIEPEDPMSQFFAKIISVIMEEERRQIIRRIQRGVNHAQNEGKWTGRTPTGFKTTKNGYLAVDTEEYEAICDALRRIDEGESYRSVERDTRFTRQTLSKQYKNHRDRYLDPQSHDTDGYGEDERRKEARVGEALDEYQQTEGDA